MEHFELAEEFGEAILSGNAAIFIGAGLSRNAGLPGWGIYWSRSGQAAMFPSITIFDTPSTSEVVASFGAAVSNRIGLRCG
jgi:hypothetical protein